MDYGFNSTISSVKTQTIHIRQHIWSLLKLCLTSSEPTSARALVKKTQEPGIKLQKADFFRNDTWTSPQTNSEQAPKIPLVHFFKFKMAATM